MKVSCISPVLRLTLCVLFSVLLNPHHSVFAQSSKKQPVPPAAREKYPFFVSANVRHLHEKLYQDVFKTILDEGLFFNSESARAEPPIQFNTPTQLKSILNFTLTNERVDHKTLLEYISTIIKYSPKASHPFKVDRHATGVDPYALVADYVGTTTGSPLTFILGPTWTLMELEVEAQLRRAIGYEDGVGGGVISPGSGMSVGMAIHLALEHAFPAVKEFGIIEAAVGKSKPVLFMSEHASASFNKQCVWTGVGVDGCIRVKVDKRGRMDLKDLEDKIKASIADGSKPFMIICTAGTAVLGAIDPISEIMDIASKYGDLWVHVDGNLAGSSFLSEKQKFRLKGVERSESYTWAVDKTLGAPFTSVVMVTRHEDITKLKYSAPYVFRKSILYNNSKWDTGDTTIQCARRPEIGKIWFLWKAKGGAKLAAHVDYTYELTNQAVEELKNRKSSFQLILDEFDSAQISFYYIPSLLRHLSESRRDSILKSSKYTEKLRASLIRSGAMAISINSLPQSQFPVPFLVMNFKNSALNIKDVEYLLDQIAFHGESDTLLSVLKPEIEESEHIKQVSEKRVAPSRPPAPTSFPDFVSTPVESLHRQFMEKFFKLLLDIGTFFETKRKSGPAYSFKTPEELLQLVDFSLLNCSLGAGHSHEEQGQEDLLDIIRSIIYYTGHCGHPYFNFHLLQGQNPYSAIADFIIGTINAPMITYEDSPLFTMMEHVVTRLIRQRVGFTKPGDSSTEDDDVSSGLITSGGSASIQMAQVTAYYWKSPAAKLHGDFVEKKPFVCFTSDRGHYATIKGAIFKGLGLDNIVRVESDSLGRMTGPALRDEVERAVKAGKIPYFVVATVGTTVLGSIDLVDEIADICKEYGMWLHIDGTYMGATIWSHNQTRRDYILKGVHRADSFNHNINKAFLTTRELSYLVTKHPSILKTVIDTGVANTIEQHNNQELYDGAALDPATKSWVHERRAGIFKSWFLIKALGLEGMSQHMEYIFKNVEFAQAEIRRRGDRFILALPKFDGLNVNFLYVPERLRNKDPKSREFIEAIDDVQYRIQKRILLYNSILISHEPSDSSAGYLILALCNSAFTHDDIKYILDLVEYYGKDM